MIGVREEGRECGREYGGSQMVVVLEGARECQGDGGRERGRKRKGGEMKATRREGFREVRGVCGRRSEREGPAGGEVGAEREGQRDGETELDGKSVV